MSDHTRPTPVVGGPPPGAPGDAGGGEPPLPPGETPDPAGDGGPRWRVIVIATLISLIVLLALVLVLVRSGGDDGDVATDDAVTTTTATSSSTTTSSSSTTSTTAATTTTAPATTLPATTSTTGGSTTTSSPPSTVLPVRCTGLSGPAHPDTVAEVFYEAWTLDDRRCAEQIATDEAVDQLFFFDGTDADWSFEGCADDEDGDWTNCFFRYEGGSAAFQMRYDEVTGWEIFAVGFTAD